jgi:hypothetical protein
VGRRQLGIIQKVNHSGDDEMLGIFKDILMIVGGSTICILLYFLCEYWWETWWMHWLHKCKRHKHKIYLSDCGYMGQDEYYFEFKCRKCNYTKIIKTEDISKDWILELKQ